MYMKNCQCVNNIVENENMHMLQQSSIKDSQQAFNMRTALMAASFKCATSAGKE